MLVQRFARERAGPFLYVTVALVRESSMWTMMCNLIVGVQKGASQLTNPSWY